MKRILALILALIMVMGVVAGCTPETTTKKNEKLNVVTTVFAYYDFLKVIGGDKVNVELILPEDKIPEEYQPSAEDLRKIKEANLVVYTSSKYDSWVDNVEGYLAANGIIGADLSRLIELKNINGSDKKDASSRLDYYVWLSPANSMLIVDELAKVLSALDKKSAPLYRQNADDYIKLLSVLDNEIKVIAEHNGEVGGMVFPETANFGYMTHSYGIESMSYKQLLETYTDEEAAEEYKEFIADNNIDTIYYSHLDNVDRVDNAVKNMGLSRKIELKTCIRPTDEEIEAGEAYLNLMAYNIDAMKLGFGIDY